MSALHPHNYQYIDEPESQYDFEGPLLEQGDFRGQAGVALIMAGVMLLSLQLLGGSTPTNNWWTMILVIPGIASLIRAYVLYHTNGISGEVNGLLFGGSLGTIVGGALLLGIDLALIWPLFLVIPGLLLLLNRKA